ncbi:MAG: hypothetical protein ACE5HB_04935 [Terriglobia bacterium]
MPLVYTGPLREVLTPALKSKIERSYAEFPELARQRVVVGLTKKRGLDAYAVGEDFCIRLRVRRRAPVSRFTIGHELTHLLQKPGLGLIPEGEVQCDIWTLARSKLFLDESPSYLDLPSSIESNWGRHARRVHELCRQALEVRKANRRYIVWLRQKLREHLTGPRQLDLFPQF